MAGTVLHPSHESFLHAHWHDVEDLLSTLNTPFKSNLVLDLLIDLCSIDLQSLDGLLGKLCDLFLSIHNVCLCQSLLLLLKVLGTAELEETVIFDRRVFHAAVHLTTAHN